MQETMDTITPSPKSVHCGSNQVPAGTAMVPAITGFSEVASRPYAYAAGYTYEKLDPEEVGRTTYENYFKRWCASSVIAGFVEPLQRKVGGYWNSFPIDAMCWARGGKAGWGAFCGTLTGAGVIIGMVIKDTEVSEEMANDIACYYSYTEMPVFEPKRILGSERKDLTIAGTPVCHTSVGRWMKSAGEPFLSDARGERCARVAADVAMETTQMLNDWKDGIYRARHKPLYQTTDQGEES